MCCLYTHSTLLLSGVLSTLNLEYMFYVYIYVHAYNIMHTFSCDNYYCPCDTFMCVECTGLVVFVLYPFSSLTLDTLYICTMHHIACSNHFEISTVQYLSSFESMLLLNTEYMYLMLECISLPHICSSCTSCI